MAEKKISKAAATKAAKKEAAAKVAPAKKAEEKKAPAAKKAAAAVVYVNAENAGFKAGDVYNALAAAEKALTVAEIAKKAKTTAEDVYLGLGWLLKEGKVASTEDNKIALA
jgi:hypothetical protein